MDRGTDQRTKGSPPSSVVRRQLVRQLGSGPDAELPEDLAEVVVDGACTEEQLLGNLAVGRAASGEAGNAGFLGGEVPFGVRRPLSGAFASGTQFAAGLLGEYARAHGAEHVVGSPELDAGVAPSSATAQPLAVQQVRAGQVDGRATALKLADRLQVRGLGLAT